MVIKCGERKQKLLRDLMKKNKTDLKDLYEKFIFNYLVNRFGLISKGIIFHTVVGTSKANIKIFQNKDLLVKIKINRISVEFNCTPGYRKNIELTRQIQDLLENDLRKAFHDVLTY